MTERRHLLKGLLLVITAWARNQGYALVECTGTHSGSTSVTLEWNQ